jgi:lipoprotein-anchoring transpeptidase ErfK/SrfK
VRASVDASLTGRRIVVHRPGRRDVFIPVAVGAPSTPTPTGRFAVTDRLKSTTPSVYGCCVLALSGHQPYLEPGWTGGNRIAIHSTFETSAIGQAVSHGCLRADEASMRRLLSLVPLGAVVTIRR